MTSERVQASVNPTLQNSERILFSILIPVFNEQAYLTRIVETVLAAPLPEGLDRELILVDDCSTDRTPEVIQELVAKYPTVVRAFRQSKNQGKGAAIRRAIQEMKGDYAIFQDADLEYNPMEYSLVLAPLLDGRADVVYAGRVNDDDRTDRQKFHRLSDRIRRRSPDFGNDGQFLSGHSVDDAGFSDVPDAEERNIYTLGSGSMVHVHALNPFL